MAKSPRFSEVALLGVQWRQQVEKRVQDIFAGMYGGILQTFQHHQGVMRRKKAKRGFKKASIII